MSQQAAFDALINFAEYEGLPADPSEWSMVNLTNPVDGYGNSWDMYEFKHVSGISAYSCGEDDHYYTWEAGPVVYDIGQADGETFICYAPQAYFQREDAIPDQHVGHIIKELTGLPRPYWEDEACENNFVLPSNISVADAHRECQKAGLIHVDMNISNDDDVDDGDEYGDDYGQVTRNSPTAAHILHEAIKLFEANDPAISHNGQINLGGVFDHIFTAHNLNQAEQYAIGSDLQLLCKEYGLGDPVSDFFSVNDSDNILGRLKNALHNPYANTPAGQLAGRHQQDDRPDIDISNTDPHELYRLVLRGEVPQISTIGWCWDDVENRKGCATEDELAFYCGYLDREYKLMKDKFIPDDVFERILPEYGKMTWNDYENDGQTNYHTMPMPGEQYIEGVRSHIRGRFMERGWAEYQNMMEATLPPLIPVSSISITPTVSDNDAIIDIQQMLGDLTSGRAQNQSGNMVMVPIAGKSAHTDESVWHHYSTGALDPTLGVDKAAFAIVINESPYVSFVAGYVDAQGGLIGEYQIPADVIQRLFPENDVDQPLKVPGNYRVRKMLGQSMDELVVSVTDKLTGAGIVDLNV